MGKGKPSNCPFCGAQDHYLVNASKWVDGNADVGQLTARSRKNLEEALQLEVNNLTFYRDAMGKTKDIELQGIFKYLSKIEQEHASVIKKILKCELPQPETDKGIAADSDRENLASAHAREEKATSFYRQAAGEAGEPRVRTVFTALSEIESDHVQLEGEALAKQ